MGNYHDRYLKEDVLLFADVFKKFIDTCLKFYRLDPCHYFSSPGKGMRGGISYLAKRYAKANNKYIKNYDLTKLSKFITYLDMNDLYGWAMSGYLPHGGFELLKNVDGFDVNSISKKSPVGYFLKVDLEYPDELHTLHNGYPLAPKKLAIPYDMV